MQTDLERRTGNVGLAGSKIVGLAVPFNSPSQDLGGFVEVWEPSAVDRTLAEGDVRALVDHDPAKVIGRTKAGTLKLRKTAAGLEVEIAPPDNTAGRDVLESVRRGDIDGMSVGFRVMPSGERWERRDGLDVRIVTDAQIVETSIVSFPAFTATDAAVAQRSLQAFRAGRGRSIRELRLRHTARGE